jgi:pimeloyl-ACP methyl ester carboxylesterase
MNKTVVLIHGSWQGGWAWEAVVQHLTVKGFGKLAPTLLGHGPGASHAGVAHRSCTEAVVAQIESAGLTDVALVGYSLVDPWFKRLRSAFQSA